MGSFTILSYFGSFFWFSVFSNFHFSRFRILNNNRSSNCNMQLKTDIKIFNLRCQWTLYDKSAPRYTYLNFYKKLNSSNQSEIYLKFYNSDSICTIESIFSLNKRFFKGLLFEYLAEFVRSTVPKIYLFEILLKKFRYVNRRELSPKCFNSDFICAIFLTLDIILRGYNYLRGSRLPIPWHCFLIDASYITRKKWYYTINCKK